MEGTTLRRHVNHTIRGDISGTITVAPLMRTASDVTVNDALSPLTMVAVMPSVTSAAATEPDKRGKVK